MKQRVLVVGVDSATFDLINPWMERGLLPNLKRVIDGGVRGKFVDSWLPITGPRWTTIATGKNAGKHGVFDFGNMLQDYRTKPVSSRDVDAVPVYDLLSESGKKVLVLNLPITYPVHPVNGVMIAGMPAPSVNEKSVYPLDLLPVLQKRGYVILPEEVYEGNNEKKMLDELHKMIDVQCEVAVELTNSRDWDFCFFVFFATDIAGHWFWKHMDQTHPLHSKENEKYADAILNVYKKMDVVLGKLIEAGGDNASVFIVSDHGMGALHKDIFINNWLLEKGFMKLKQDAFTRFKYAVHKAGFTLENAYKIVQRTGFAKMTAQNGEGAEKTRQFLLNTFFISFDDVDWSKTVAYSATNYGPIFINLKGREVQGIVTPGEEYERVCRQISSELALMRDEQGEKVFEQIKLKHDLAQGRHLENAPDIIFLVKDMKYTTNRYFEFGSNKLFGNPHRDMSGDHRNNGLFIAYGKHLRTSRDFITVQMTDLVPTILHLLDVPIPNDLDGRVLKEIFEPSSEPALRAVNKTSPAASFNKDKEKIRRVAQSLAKKFYKKTN